MSGSQSQYLGSTRVALAAIASFTFAGFAHADFAFPNVMMQFYASSGESMMQFSLAQDSSVAEHLGGSVFLFEGGTNGANNAWGLEWSMTVSPSFNGSNTAGPPGTFINVANIAVTNNTMANQSFFVEVTMPVAPPIGIPTLSQGDVAVSIQSFVGAGATLQNNGMTPIYQALIDGNVQASLMGPGTAVTSTGFLLAGLSEAFGQPVPIVTDPAMTNISIMLEIEVTAQSIATVIGVYQIAPIPAPAALPLLALGALAGRRRRRRD